MRQERNRYLAKHPRAQVATAEKTLRSKIAQLKIAAWLEVRTEGRASKITVTQPALEEAARLDGCYVIKTDLPACAASQQVVHDRYKELPLVRAGVPYMQDRAPRNPSDQRADCGPHPWPRVGGDAGLSDPAELSRAWTSLDVTVEEGLHQLQTLCSTEVKVEGGGSCLRIPTPSAGATA